MRIGITDSGVGGLSVCAEVEARLRHEPVGTDIELVYINAALRDDYSYNAMQSRQQKLETFGRFLDNVAERYRPDLLYIACNSLSVLFDDPFFDHHRQIPIGGIVGTGTRAALTALGQDESAAIIVFATPTTIDEGTYRRNLLAAGVAPERIVQQACPGLPDAISNDFTGGQARKLLERYVPEALDRFDTLPSSLIAFLGCTHYGYQAAVFEALLHAHAARVRILNPNQDAAAGILGQINVSPGKGTLGVRFVTPYPIPDKPMTSLPVYLGDRAPGTIDALRNFSRDPRLYRA